MKFAVTMMTRDRSPKPNYLGQTLDNLARSGVFESKLLHSFTLVDSGSLHFDFLHEGATPLDENMAVVTGGHRGPTENACYTLRRGAATDAPWVLFLEDDIDVCGHFLESVGHWLDDHAEHHRVFPLGANYEVIKGLHKRGETYWEYPVDCFYGTLAVAIRNADAVLIADYLESVAHLTTYDLQMYAWAQTQGITHFLTPAPSFVQHIGRESIIRPGGEFISYDSFPGHGWSYKSRVTA